MVSSISTNTADRMVNMVIQIPPLAVKITRRWKRSAVLAEQMCTDYMIAVGCLPLKRRRMGSLTHKKKAHDN